MERTLFTAETESGALSGWIAGDGPRVLAIHGGPGMSYDYLDDAVEELATRYRVATFQQRGLAPSTQDGAFTVAEAVADIAAVLDGLGWETAYLMGHSWGGHLVLHAALELADRLDGVLSVDPLGAVGDGGMEAFGAEMTARVREADRERARLLDEKDMAGEATPEETREAFSLFWPSYFAVPPSAPPVPDLEFCAPANLGLWADLTERLPGLESSLPSITVPVGVLVGGLSPMPPSAGTDSAARIPGAWTYVEPKAGHFVWHEAPGCLVTAMDRLVAETRPETRPDVPAEPDVPDAFDVYTFVVLRRPDDAPEMSDQELDDLQAQHLAYRADLRRQGLLAVNGPCGEQSDPSYRGMSIFACDPVEAARLSDGDPSVAAGRLSYDVMEWWVAADSLAFPNAEASVGDRRSMPQD